MSTFSTDEKVSMLFKKSIGVPCTGDDNQKPYAAEATGGRYKAIFEDQLYSQQIPTAAAPLDTNGNNAKAQDIAGGTGYTLNTEHNLAVPHIKYCCKMSLVNISGHDTRVPNSGSNTIRAFKLQNGHTFLIPATYGDQGTKPYAMALWTHDGVSKISEGVGKYFVDTEAGIVTFYDWENEAKGLEGAGSQNGGTGVGFRLSYYRYVGKMGPGLIKDTSENFIYSNELGNLVIGKKTNDQGRAVDVSGSAYFSQNVQALEFEAFSDIMLKSNIKPIEKSLSKLNKINGISFNWNETGKKSYGVLAQDIEKILPEAVRESSTGYKTVNYNSLVGFLVQTCKDLNDKIIELENKI